METLTCHSYQLSLSKYMLLTYDPWVKGNLSSESRYLRKVKMYYLSFTKNRCY